MQRPRTASTGSGTARPWRAALAALVAAGIVAFSASRPGLTDELPPCPDLDADGYAACDAACDAAGLNCGDCDDASGASHPGATEACNHLDDDCSGAVDEASPKVFAQQLLTDNGASPGARFGAALAVMGDLDGDGVDDLAIGAPTTDTASGNDAGAVTLVSGATRTAICTATDTMEGRAGDRLGISVARLADLTGDGIPDLAAGAPGTTAPNTQGRVLIISGADCSVVRAGTDSVIVTLPGGGQSQSYSEIGTVVTSIGDVNGDGAADILAGDPNALLGNINVLAPQNGRAVVFSGATGAPLRRIVPQLNGENNVRFGSSVASLGDLTGDGIGDYAIGSILSPDTSDTQFGKVRVYSGSNGALLRTLADLSPGAGGGGLGHAIAALPDLNGDGVTDLAAGEALGDDGGTLDTGAVVLFSGADGALLRRCTAPDGLAADQMGRALAALPDLNGDGVAEIAASAPLDDTPRGVNSGSIVIFSGADCAPLTRVFDRIGSSGARLADRSLVAIPDFLGDPDPDLLAGSGYDASNAGTVPGRALLLGIESDCDDDGFTPADGDCDDANPAAWPDADEVCDGADNNCDTQVDENDPPDGQPCQTGQPGVCGAGKSLCSGEPYTCVPDAGSTPEICDGLDNDCDGETDEGTGSAGEPCSTGLPGVCAAGTLQCGAGPETCVQDVPASAEICDGLDNDCDGATDQDDPGGGQACVTGQPGVCAAGITLCDGGAIVCTPAAGGSVEVCNGLDDDCDGAVDDGDPEGGGTCSTGEQGVCAPGIRRCLGGAIVCQQNIAAAAETCDALDNNCDGLIDEGNPGGNDACETGLLGVCGAGVTLCSVGLVECVPNAYPLAETCNGLDDNCDGTTDENNPGSGIGCETGEPGICNIGRTLCSAGALACVRNAQPSVETCDGADNDCNGVVDDGPDGSDGDGVNECGDNCPVIPNPGQEDGDFDGVGDACDTCPTVSNADQNLCACHVCGPSNITLERGASGNGTVRWQVDVEHAIVGFHIVQVDNKGKETRLNTTIISCVECTSDRGAAYTVPISRLKPAGGVFVDQVSAGGQVTRYGPAANFQGAGFPANLSRGSR